MRVNSPAVKMQAASGTLRTAALSPRPCWRAPRGWTESPHSQSVGPAPTFRTCECQTYFASPARIQKRSSMPSDIITKLNQIVLSILIS